MIPSSGVYRIPRADAASRNADAVRYARFEYGTSSLSWMLRARPQTPGLLARVGGGLVAAFERFRARPTRRPATQVPLRSGAAAVHFAGDPVHAHAAHHRPHPHTAWEAHATSSLLLPMAERDETPEACECQP